MASNAVPEGPGLPTGWLELVIGTDFPSQAADDMDPQLIWRFQGTNVFRELKGMNFREAVTGQLPVQLATDDVSGLLATVQILLHPIVTTLRTWQQATFDLVQGAYWELRRDEERTGVAAAVRDRTME